MSDHIIRIIPNDPYFCITEQQSQKIVVLIKQSIKADSVKAYIQESPVFIDCGFNLESISCPHCSEILDFGWWQDVMSNAAENNFMDLTIKLPCCGSDSTLDDLIYYYPCGFSRVEFAILNPESDINDSLLSKLESLLEITMRVIHEHI